MTLVDQADLIKQREVKTWNEPTESLKLASKEEAQSACAHLSLDNLMLFVISISFDLEATPNDMGNCISKYLRALEACVRGGEIQELEVFHDRLRAEVRPDSPELHRSIKKRYNCL